MSQENPEPTTKIILEESGPLVITTMDRWERFRKWSTIAGFIAFGCVIYFQIDYSNTRLAEMKELAAKSEDLMDKLGADTNRLIKEVELLRKAVIRLEKQK